MYKKLCIIIYILILSTVLFANDFLPNEDVYWIDVDAPQLSESEVIWLNSIFNAATLNEESDTNGISSIGSAIDFIEAKIQEGSISAEDRSSIGILEKISLYPYNNAEQYSGNRNTLFRDRQKSIQLLGMLGGEYSLEAIDKILEFENDPTLVQTVITVYSNLVPPFSDLRIKYFTYHLKRAQYVTGDDSLILTILQAIENMYKKHWTMDNSSLFVEILALQDLGRTEVVRNYAYSIARLLAGL